MKKALIGIVCTWLCWQCATVGSQAQDLVILHTNDLHSQMETYTQGRNAGQAGIKARSDYIAQMRQEHPDLLYLDAGDYNQGTPFFNVFHGVMEVEVMNALQLDAAAFGNHEFDNGIPDLVARLKKAQFQTVCANYIIKDRSLRKLVKPYAIFERGGHTIGVIGLLVNLNGLTSGENLAKLIYQEPAPIVNKLATQLRKKGCDLVVCLSHLGYDKDVDLAEHSHNVDIIIGGHTHTFMEESLPVTDLDGKIVTVVQAGAKGVYVGKLTVTF